MDVMTIRIDHSKGKALKATASIESKKLKIFLDS